jgi:hypothetical protein
MGAAGLTTGTEEITQSMTDANEKIIFDLPATNFGAVIAAASEPIFLGLA